MKKVVLSMLLSSIAMLFANAQATIFAEEIEMPDGFVSETVLMPPSPLSLQVLFVGGVDLVQTTPTYGYEAGIAYAKEWHDFIGFTPDETGQSLGWVSVNHEMIYQDNRIGDGGGDAIARVMFFGHEDMPHQGVLRRAQPAIADQDHLYPVAGGHPFGLGLHRAGVGIDI